MQLAITLAHHDHDYVERRGGFGLLTYLRGAPDRCAHRRASLERAFEVFTAAGLEDRREAATGGLGLLVLQRALLPAEDLGLLLHAFAGVDPWNRLRTANIPAIDDAYIRAAHDLDGCLNDAFCLISPEHIKSSGDVDQQRLLQELRNAARTRWSHMLERAARLWLDHRNVAKSTMHGFPIIAGAHVEGPPGAGELAAGIDPQPGRYVVAVTSRVRGTEVTTDRTIVSMSADAVAGYRRNGRVAIRLVEEICAAQASTIMSGHAATVPLHGQRFLDSGSRETLRRLLKAQAEMNPDEPPR